MISEDEICQIIMVQYPEEDVGDVAASRPTSVAFSLGPPSTLDINLDQNQVTVTVEENEAKKAYLGFWIF